MNPFIARYTDIDTDTAELYIQHDGFIDPRYNLSEHERLSSQERCFSWSSASWKRMLIFQPPPREVCFQCLEMSDGEGDDVISVAQEGGVRLNEMRQKLVDHWQVCPNCPILGLEDNTDNRWIYDGSKWIYTTNTTSTGWEMLEQIRRRASEGYKPT